MPEFAENCIKGHRLQGKVKYCPFCGTPVAVSQIESIVPQTKLEPTTPSLAPKPAISLTSEQKTTKKLNPITKPVSESVLVAAVTAAPVAEIPKQPAVPLPVSEPKPAWQGLKYNTGIILVVVLLGAGFIGYGKLVLQNGNAHISPDAETETAIRVAIEEMKLTGQSLFKEKQMRKSLQNAKEALALSESYRETVNQLELANTNTIRKTKEHLSAYLTKVAWLSRHPEQFSSAIKAFAVINRKDTFMVDLLKQHVTSFTLNKDMSEEAWKLELEPVSIQLGL